MANSEALAEKPRIRYRTVIFQAYLVGAIVVFIILAVLAKTIAYFTFDVTITHAVQSLQVGWFDALMGWISWLGFRPQFWILVVSILVLLMAVRLRWEMVVAGISVVASAGLAHVIKLIIERPRPTVDLVKVISALHDYSFPSGHVLYYTTFFGFLLFLAYTLLKQSWLRTVLMLVLGGLVGLVGLSRIHQGHHWASDVLGAYLLGSVWLSLSIVIYRWGKERFTGRAS